MKDNKPLYEKIYIFIGIIAGICTIVGIDILNNNENDSINLENNKIETGDQSPIVIGDNNNVILENTENEDIIAIDSNNVTLSYAVATDERFKNVYVTDDFQYNNYTDLSDPNNKYYIENNCVTIMNISNQLDHEIKINKYRIIVNEIEQNLEPVISISLVSYSDIDVNVSNEGWSDIGRLKIKISDEKNLLYEYYEEKDLVYEINGLKIGETKTIHILDKKFMKKNLDNLSDDLILYPIFNFTSDEISVSEKSTGIGLGYDGPYVLACGDLGASVYGIEINTNHESYTNEYSINECIASGEIKDIPICFFPDKSCKMKFYVEFDIFNGYETIKIKSEPRYLEFKISSLSSKRKNIGIE